MRLRPANEDAQKRREKEKGRGWGEKGARAAVLIPLLIKAEKKLPILKGTNATSVWNLCHFYE